MYLDTEHVRIRVSNLTSKTLSVCRDGEVGIEQRSRVPCGGGGGGPEELGPMGRGGAKEKGSSVQGDIVGGRGAPERWRRNTGPWRTGGRAGGKGVID
jgi:hypothetical protein